MDAVQIRKAGLEDLPVLRQFEQGVIAAERPFDSTLKNGTIYYYDLEAMLQAENVALLVAETGGEVVGSGYARIERTKPYQQHSVHAYLGFMYIVPAHRGKGINRKLIEDLKAWAVAKGVNEFRLEVYHENLAAIRAYEKSGFKKLMIQMRMSANADQAG